MLAYIGGIWTLEEWWSKETAIAYFQRIKTLESLKYELWHEIGTHGAINVFEHFCTGIYLPVPALEIRKSGKAGAITPNYCAKISGLLGGI